MNLKRNAGGAVFVNSSRHFWIDSSGQPVPGLIKSPCVVIQKEGVSFALELADIPVLRELIDEAERALLTLT